MPEISLTALIDVVFLLLIFFMVSTTFEQASELAIELPKASPDAEVERAATLEVSIDAQGRHYVNGRRLVNSQVQTVREALRKAAAGRESPPLVVNADGKAPHQSVISVMDAASQLGFARLSFTTQRAVDGG